MKIFIRAIKSFFQDMKKRKGEHKIGNIYNSKITPKKDPSK